MGVMAPCSRRYSLNWLSVQLQEEVGERKMRVSIAKEKKGKEREEKEADGRTTTHASIAFSDNPS